MASPDRESADTVKVPFHPTDRDAAAPFLLKVSTGGATLEVSGPGGFCVRTAHGWLLARGVRGMHPEAVLLKSDSPARDEDVARTIESAKRHDEVGDSRPAFHGTMGAPPPAFFGVGPSRDSGKHFSMTARMLSQVEANLVTLWERIPDKMSALRCLNATLARFAACSKSRGNTNGHRGLVMIDVGEDRRGLAGTHALILEWPRRAFPNSPLKIPGHVYPTSAWIFRTEARGFHDVPRAFCDLLGQLAMQVFDETARRAKVK